MDNSANNKRIAKNTLILYVRMFFIMAVTLYTSRVILQVLGVEDFGIYNVVGGVVAMMGLLKGAMSSATTRFITFELGRNNLEQLKKTFSVCMMIYALIFIIFIILAETIGLWFLNSQLTIPPERLQASNWVYQFTIISVVIEMMSQPYNAVIISHEKMSFYAYVSILEVILRLLVVYLLSIIPIDNLGAYGFLMMMTSIIIFVVYHIYCKYNFAETHFQYCNDWKLFKSILSYSGWNLFGSASSVVKGQGLNIILNIFFNPVVNAARGIAFQINSAISQFSQNFYTAVRPQITKYYAQEDLDSMFKLVFRSGRFSFYLNLFLGVPLIVETPGLIHIWLGQEPDYVVMFSRIIIIISLIDAMAHPLMTSIHSTGHVALYQSVVGSMKIMNLPISYLFLKHGYPPVIVFQISLIITTLSLFMRLLILKRYISSFPVMKYVLKVLVTCMLVAVSSFILPLAIHIDSFSSSLNIIINCIICFLSVFCVVYLLGLNGEEKQFLRNKLCQR